MEDALAKVRVYRDPPPFLGGGAWAHIVPLAVVYSVMRGELLTSYTPYQAEASQGVLQALFEYQSLMAELLEMDVVNSSMYDGASATGEAFLEALRVRKGRRRILVPETMNPQVRDVAQLYTQPHGVIEEYLVDKETGEADLGDLESRIDSETAAVYLEYPSYTGVVDSNAEAVGELAHKSKALFIMGVDPVAVALYKPPGELGADIAVGDGQPLGLGMNYGGPSLGIYAVRWDGKLVRQMPGRLVGLARDADGERAFAMILQTREQHIRRAKATSNITTNNAFMAIIAAAYMAYLGGEGLRRLAEEIWYKTRYTAKVLGEAGLQAPLFHAEYWRDIAVRVPQKPYTFEDLANILSREGLLIGPSLSGLTPWLYKDAGIIAVTEAHSKEHIDKLASAIREALGGGR